MRKETAKIAKRAGLDVGTVMAIFKDPSHFLEHTNPIVKHLARAEDLSKAAFQARLSQRFGNSASGIDVNQLIFQARQEIREAKQSLNDLPKK